ncbi:hypothetical protein [uncultured Selenomonas sp.]|uniref:hypothetical protein n=1 Tax=uncultured Selenomonas sp. TaxID=159275 RepID=UPI0028DC9F11|nr:hypothetical protein [uncultured Selenomonas sp.]
MFEWIGRINDYAATWQLKKEANWRIKTGEAISLSDSKKQMAQEVRQNFPKNTGAAAKVTDSTRLSIISQKARSGKKLTPEELRLLKENDEALYQKAKKADDTREELKAALKRAKTKEAARRILMEAQLKVAIEALSGGGDSAAMPSSASGAGSTGNAASAGEAAAKDGRAAANGAAAPEGGATSFSEGAPAALAGTGEAAPGAGHEAQAGAAGTPGAGHEAQAGVAGAQAGADGAVAKGAGKEHDAIGEKKPSFLEERVAQLKESYARAMAELENAKDAKPNFDDTYLIVFRALADEWREFTSSKAWEKLPENEREAKLRGKHGGSNNYGRQGADALLAMADSYKVAGKEEMPQLVDLFAHANGAPDASFSAAGRKIGGIDTKL